MVMEFIGKRRFGISIEERLAIDLDLLATRLGTTRSSLVERAIEEYVHDRLHIITPHDCEGILLVKHSAKLAGKVSNVIEGYTDIALMGLHFHTGDGTCVRMLHLKGNSTRITEFERRLREIGVDMTRYIVIRTPQKDQEENLSIAP
ncbi:MAG: ribbon-helix-helix domain-containing protein [Desulfurococcales archaeon]|nr:ribbon-helix-helix domain-containing protein [Desulfurococcales archaeon]